MLSWVSRGPISSPVAVSQRRIVRSSRPGRQAGPVGGEGQRPDRVGVTLESVGRAAARRIPEADGPVPRPRGDPAPIRAVGHRDRRNWHGRGAREASSSAVASQSRDVPSSAVEAIVRPSSLKATRFTAAV